MSISVWGIDHGEEIGKAWGDREKRNAAHAGIGAGGVALGVGGTLAARKWGPGAAAVGRAGMGAARGRATTVGEQVGRGVNNARTNTATAYRSAVGAAGTGLRQGAGAARAAGGRAAGAARGAGGRARSMAGETSTRVRTAGAGAAGAARQRGAAVRSYGAGQLRRLRRTQG